jgi:hypothetical protein
VNPACPDCETPFTRFLQRGVDIVTGREMEVWDCPECGVPFAIEITPLGGDAC